MRQVINTDQAPSPVGPYNQAVRTGNLLFVSGQIAIIPETGELATGDIETETHQVMRNLGAILRAAGTDYGNVIKCSVFVKDMGLYGRINAVYSEYFQDEFAPARELVEVSALPKYVNIEISVIAMIK